MSKAKEIIGRLKANNVRYFACDNVSEYIYEGEHEELILELTEKFNDVLDTLIIDRDNDPNSHDTGKRLAKMYVNEIMQGRYHPEPESTAFPNDTHLAYSGMIVVRAEIKSVCSHHHQPVRGVCYIGIIPNEKVIGLSKYIRIAQHAARRGTLQEELTVTIANRIKEVTGSNDVAVYLMARHGCCENRGVEAGNSVTQTAVMNGRFLEISSVKEEFFSQVRISQQSNSLDM